MRKVFALLILLFMVSMASAQKLDMSKLKGIPVRSIGPAAMSGRMVAIDAVHAQPQIIYAGAASGGVWKSTNQGIDWEPIFDKENTQAIGSIAVQQSNPSIVWVGTGEGNPRNSSNSGGGIYKSIDAGKTWKLMGLELTKNIHRIIIDPTNPNIVYAGVIGFPWGEHPERGVFKTTDGGKTWEKILFVNNGTGCAELIMDSSNPNKLFAAMWEHRRKPWTFNSGGHGSGLYVTLDGGKTWSKKTDKDGLPEGNLGRIGLAISKNKPEVVYALIESKKNALYRSADGGTSWKMVNDKAETGGRPFYYSEIYVDPTNENRLYSVATTINISEDGGKSFQVLLGFNDVHVDHHAFWIHPTNPNFIINGNDGGLNISYNAGKTWRYVENLPVGQFYHVNVDNETPYNVYGGLQDNGSWVGPSYVWRTGGIRNSYWQEVLFGDGFDVLPDPENSRYGYAMSQGGNISYYDRQTGHFRFIAPTHPEADFKLRFNWNAPIAQDPFDKSSIYYGSQFVHKSTNKGHSWEIISPDLTTNDPEKLKQYETGGLTIDDSGAEMHCTILAIAPSPLERGVVWAGTDDGNVQLTRDGGKTWTNLTSKIAGLPKGGWIPQIKASAYKAGEAMVVINNYRNSDFKPYVFRTRDYGQTWENITPAAQVDSWALCVLQDTKEPRLHFLGTENGWYVSLDDGKDWSKWTNNFPKGVPVMDMTIQERENDLVMATFGRAMWVLDDISFLRELTRTNANVLNKTLGLINGDDGVVAITQQPPGERFAGHANYEGTNRDFDLMVTYIKNKPVDKSKEAVKEDPKAKTTTDASKTTTPAKDEKKINYDSISLQAFDTKGLLIRTVKQLVPKDSGVHRIYWDMREKNIVGPSREKTKSSAPDQAGLFVLPGQYKLRLTYGDQKDSTMVNVMYDPRIKIPQGVIEAQYQLQKQLQNNVKLAHEATQRLAEIKETIDMFDTQLKEKTGEGVKAIKDKGKALKDSVNAYYDWMLGKQLPQGFTGGKDPAVSNFIFGPNFYISTSLVAPGPTEERLVQQADKKLNQYLTKINRFFSAEWTAYRAMVEKENFSLFKDYPPLKK
jgi:photosystem II stability/assembly factor-like uncharacterized protein